MKNNKFVITAAGGNATTIEVIKSSLSREEYEKRGIDLIKEFEKLSVEQSGFLILDDNHFEMSGGEFCGNAARSAAILLSKIKNNNKVSLTVSGFERIVTSTVTETCDNVFIVECLFPELNVNIKNVELDSETVPLVDFGSIAYVVIDDLMPLNYKFEHRRIVNSLNLNDKDAIGVLWVEKIGNSIKIDPVIWVKSINTFFYETSCGSGSIAVSKVFKSSNIIQPSNKNINVEFNKNRGCVLKSEMEIIYGINFPQNKRIPKIKNLKEIKKGEDGEKLVNLKKYCPNVICKYIKKDMLPITGDNIFVRKSVARKIYLANKNLNKRIKSFNLKVVFGYRYPDIQKKYFLKMKENIKKNNNNLTEEELNELTHSFVAKPEVSGHPCGAAIDLTIVDNNNEDVDMGTGIADFSKPEIIKTFSKKITKKQLDNRVLLLNLMTEQGFAPYLGEWWHFSYGDMEWACFYGEKSSIYSEIFFSID